MIKLYFIWFLLLGCAFTSWSLQLPDVYSYYNPSKTDENMTECEMALEKFAQSSSNYTLCTIRNSQPIRACELCVDSYMDVKAAHENILTSEINGTKCKDKLINLDRLEIIESTFRGIKDIWYRGFCDKCFDWSKGTPVLSNATKQFKIYFETAHACINNHIKENMLRDNKTDKICKDCMDDYVQLNSFYDSLKTTSETKGICMDIVDSMNATRSFWSGVLNCCKLRRTPELIFLCCTGLITALPVLFYLSAKIFFQAAPRIEVRQYDHVNEPVNCMATTSSRGR